MQVAFVGRDKGDKAAASGSDGLFGTSLTLQREAWQAPVQVKATLTLNLRASEFCTHAGQRALGATCVGMRWTEDPLSPLDHVLRDGLGFKQVFAWVGKKRVALTPRIQTQVATGAGRVNFEYKS